MSRVKTGVVRRKRHKKVLKQTKGFRGANNRLYKRAHEALLHAGQYAYIGRKLRKRDFRRLWIIRIKAGLGKINDAPAYSRFINLLKKNKIALNRKILADLAVNDFSIFSQLVTKVLGK